VQFQRELFSQVSQITVRHGLELPSNKTFSPSRQLCGGVGVGVGPTRVDFFCVCVYGRERNRVR